MPSSVQRDLTIELGSDAAQLYGTDDDPTGTHVLSHASSPLDLRSIEEVIDDLDYSSAAPPGALWLEKAHAEKRRERRRFMLAWIVTFVIASAILAGAYLLIYTQR